MTLTMITHNPAHADRLGGPKLGRSGGKGNLVDRGTPPSDKEGFISGREGFPKGFYEGIEGGTVGMVSS